MNLNKSWQMALANSDWSTAKAFCEDNDVSEQQITLMRKNKPTMPIGTIGRIANSFGYGASEFIKLGEE